MQSKQPWRYGDRDKKCKHTQGKVDPQRGMKQQSKPNKVVGFEGSDQRSMCPQENKYRSLQAVPVNQDSHTLTKNLCLCDHRRGILEKEMLSTKAAKRSRRDYPMFC